MAGHVHYNKEKYISIVDLVISPSDHIQDQRGWEDAKIILSGNYPIGTYTKRMTDVRGQKMLNIEMCFVRLLKLFWFFRYS